MRGIKLKLRGKLTLGLSAIAVILLVSCTIQVMEYSRMSNYVSSLIADDVSSINVASRLSEISNRYNLEILALIGGEGSQRLPEFDDSYFRTHCDSLRMSFGPSSVATLADSLMYSYSAYMLTAQELKDVMGSDFIDTRSWYFERLQPRFSRLRSDIDALSAAIYKDLEKDSATFERGFYRSIIPGIVAVGVGLLLVLMLFFFLTFFYVKPLEKMASAINAYRTSDKRYNVRFEGDDQMAELNDGLLELTEENRRLRSHISTNRVRTER